MATTHPLTVGVEQAGQLLGVGRSTAYELVRSGDLKCLRLRRRIIVPVAHLADRLGVRTSDVWDALAVLRAAARTSERPTPPAVDGSQSESSPASLF